MKHIILVNPVSGNQKGKKRGIAIQKILRKCNINAKLIVSKYKGELTEISKKLSTTEKCRFYSVGGDGTLNEIVSGIIGSNSEIVVIPCGTGNDFVKTISKYRSLRKIVKESINKESIKTDVIKLNNNKYCINILNTGFDAMVAKNLDIFRKVPFISGKAKYNLSIFYTLLSNRNFKFKIRYDNNKYNKGNFTLAAICNGRFYGGGVSPCKDANVNDGIINTCIVDATSIIKKMQLLPKYKQGNHYGLPQVQFNTCKNVSIVSNHIFPVSIDGEIIYTNKIKAIILKDAINIVHIK